MHNISTTHTCSGNLSESCPNQSHWAPCYSCHVYKNANYLPYQWVIWSNQSCPRFLMVAAAWLLPLICSNHERFPDVLLFLLYSIISQHNKLIISEEPFSFAAYLMVLQLYSLVTTYQSERRRRRILIFLSSPDKLYYIP